MCSEFQGPCPGPAASGSSQPCVVSCGASRVVIFPPPVLVTFPGPILSTCPQETVLGSPGMPEGSLGTALGSSGMALGSPGMPEGSPGTALGSSGMALGSHGAPIPKFTSRPILGVDPQETLLGSSGMALGSSGMALGSSGMALGSSGTPLGSHGAPIPRSGSFIPNFTSRPILGLDPQETLLGFSGMALGSSGMALGSSGMALGSSGMLEGGAGTSRSSLRSHGAPIPRSGRSVPKSGPRRASRCSYVFTSRWIHPCRRSSCGSQQPAGNGSQEQIPDPEKPGKENEEEVKEEEEVLEV